MVGKPEGRRPLRRPKRRWVDNIRMNLQEVGMWVYGLDWAGQGQRQVVDACDCGNGPKGSVKCGEFLD